MDTATIRLFEPDSLIAVLWHFLIFFVSSIVKAPGSTRAKNMSACE